MTDDNPVETIEPTGDEEHRIALPGRVASFTDDRFGHIVDYLVERGVVDDFYAVESLELEVTVNGPVKVTDIERLDTQEADSE